MHRHICTMLAPYKIDGCRHMPSPRSEPRRRLERKWRSSHLEEDYIAYRRACRVANKTIVLSRQIYYRDKINAAGSDHRKRWSGIRDALHQTDRLEVTTNEISQELCNRFADYFTDKIAKIKTLIAERLKGTLPDPMASDSDFTGKPLSKLSPPSVDEVEKFICSMPAKSSPIDAIPTSIIKSCADVFAPLIARLISLSFENGVFPSRFKSAAVTPLLKKKGLDRANVANYRPISNLHTLSKIVERFFLSRVRAHVEQAPSFNRMQSAYRKDHSTETALLKLTNDIFCSADEKSRTLLIQLDLSAAFDTIDSNTLLSRLERTFGLAGSALAWISSYTGGRSQFVRLGDFRSHPTTCKYGVPQGSVLGPFLFSLYIAPIAEILNTFGVQHAQYADDSQLYIKLKGTVSLSVMENCFTAIQNWFTTNGLSINPEKSEIIVVGTAARQRHEDEIGTLSLGDVDVPVSGSVRSLGVTLDSTMSFDAHTDSVCRSSFHHIRALRRIRKLITPANMMTVATAVVSSRLDYCNSLLYGMSSSNVRKLQRVQNDLARLVTR